MLITNIKKLVLILGIVVVSNMFFNFGIDTFYDAPEFDDFCVKEMASETYSSKETCESAGGLWNEDVRLKTIREEGTPVPVVIDEVKREGWCDVYSECGEAYESARDFYNRNVFVILVILGMASIVGGFLIKQSYPVSLGFSFAGIVSLIIGSARYWSAMDDYLRFIILGLALVVLVWLGMKKFKDDK